MGKRFVTRSRAAWEARLLVLTTENHEDQAGARAWLAERLDGYVQSTPDLPITLAVPDRFVEFLGDATETPSNAVVRQQRAAVRSKRATG